MVLTGTVNERKMFMNEKFYALSEEKQNRIINAGFKVFSENSYRKSPVGEIAAEAGISKSLLFFYFRNKKELYLFLLKTSEEITKKKLLESGSYLGSDIFDIMYRGLLAKAEMMKEYPDMSRFAIKAYYEKDPEVVKEVQEVVAPYTKVETNTILPPLDLSLFKDGLDIDKMVEDYKKIIEFWKTLYLK